MKKKTLMALVKSMLDVRGYYYEVDDMVVKFGVQRNNCVVDIKMLVEEEAGVIVVYGFVGLVVKNARRAAVLELMNDKNAYNHFSTLFVNPSDGQVMCRALCYGNKKVLTDNEVAAAFSSVVVTIDDAFPEIVCTSMGMPPELIPSDADDVAPECSDNSEDIPVIGSDAYQSLSGSSSLLCWAPNKDNRAGEHEG